MPPGYAGDPEWAGHNRDIQSGWQTSTAPVQGSLNLQCSGICLFRAYRGGFWICMPLYCFCGLFCQALTNIVSLNAILSLPALHTIVLTVSWQLGLEDTTNRGNSTVSMGDNLPFVNLGDGDTAVKVVAANHFTCVLLHDETVK